MKITVIAGTPQKGVTYLMKETFLKHLGDGHTVTEFYPKDLPAFCLGCKNCFLRGEDKCPHAPAVAPVWEAIMEADLLVFAYPVYALRAPASIKSLLDHLCVHWLVHRPEPEMFQKTAVIITNSVGAPNGSAQKDVKTSLNWMGLSTVYCAGMGMMGDIIADQMTQAHRSAIEKSMGALAKKVKRIAPTKRMSPKVALLFQMAKMLHAMVLNGETEPSLDNQHYLNHGWIQRKAHKA